MVRHGSALGIPPEETLATTRGWDALIAGSYALLDDAQCESSGLVPNWWQPAGPER
jgi:hypothetical protein